MASTRPGGALCFASYVNVASVDRVGTRTLAVQSEILSNTVFSLIKEGTIERGLQVVTILRTREQQGLWVTVILSGIDLQKTDQSTKNYDVGLNHRDQGA
jgi:hypothetical protein